MPTLGMGYFAAIFFDLFSSVGKIAVAEFWKNPIKSFFAHRKFGTFYFLHIAHGGILPVNSEISLIY